LCASVANFLVLREAGIGPHWGRYKSICFGGSSRKGQILLNGQRKPKKGNEKIKRMMEKKEKWLGKRRKLGGHQVKKRGELMGLVRDPDDLRATDGGT